MKKFYFFRRVLPLLTLLFLSISSAWAESWQLVSNISDIEAGATYLIATNNKTSVYNGNTSSGHLSTSAGTLSNGMFTAPNDAYEVTLVGTSTSNAYYIKRNGDNKYISATATKSGSFSQTAASGFLWTFAGTDGFTVSGKVSNSSVYFRSYNDASFRTYGNTAGAAIFLYKKVSGTTPDPTTYSFTLDIVGEGEVSFTDEDDNVVSAGDALNPRTVITPEFTPADGFEFTSWEYLKSTGEWGILNSESFTITKDVQFRVTFTAVTPKASYPITIQTPENGTLVIKDGATVINSGDNVEEGKTLTVEVVPSTGYRFKNWGYKDGDANWVGNMTSTFTHIMPSAPCSFKATFEEIPVYTVAWSVNGTIVKTNELQEGASVTAPTTPEDIIGKTFTGWVETSTVNPAETPAYVTPSSTAIKTVTYYAVFATATAGGGIPTFSKYEKVTVAPSDWSGTYIMVANNKIVELNGNKTSEMQLSSSSFSATTEQKNKEVVVAKRNGNYTIYLNEKKMYLAQSGSSTSITMNASNTGNTFEWTLSTTGIQSVSVNTRYLMANGTVVKCYIPGSTYNYVQLYKRVESSGISYSDYCTSIKYTRKVTAGNYGTICLPYAVAADAHEGITFYNVAGVQKSEEVITGVVFEEETHDLVAGKPYVLKAAEEGTMSLTLSGAAESLQSATGLVGNLGERAEIEYDGSNTALYILSSNQLRKVVCTGVYVGQNKAYFDLSDVDVYTPQQAAAPGRISLSVEGYNTATGIDTLAGSATDSQKFLKDGQLFILRNGVLYNALGQVVE